MTHNVGVSAVVRLRSRVLSHCLPRASRGDQTRNEDKNFKLHITAPLQKHFVMHMYRSHRTLNCSQSFKIRSFVRPRIFIRLPIKSLPMSPTPINAPLITNGSLFICPLLIKSNVKYPTPVIKPSCFNFIS